MYCATALFRSSVEVVIGLAAENTTERDGGGCGLRKISPRHPPLLQLRSATASAFWGCQWYRSEETPWYYILCKRECGAKASPQTGRHCNALMNILIISRCTHSCALSARLPQDPDLWTMLSHDSRSEKMRIAKADDRGTRSHWQSEGQRTRGLCSRKSISMKEYHSRSINCALAALTIAIVAYLR